MSPDHVWSPFVADVTDQAYEATEDIGRLVIHPRNPRVGDVDKIRESIRTNGFYGVVVAQRSTGYVLAGNHRVLAAKAEGLTHLPVTWIECDDETATRILLVDNRASDVAIYDDRELLAILQEFDIGDLFGTGWTDADIEELEKLVGTVDEDVAQIPEIEPEPEEESDDFDLNVEAPEIPEDADEIFNLNILVSRQHRDSIQRILVKVRDDNGLSSTSEALVFAMQDWAAGAGMGW